MTGRAQREGFQHGFLSSSAGDDLARLDDLFLEWPSKGLPIPSLSHDIAICTDAGEIGFGGHILFPTSSEEFFDALPLRMLGTSSTHRELYAQRTVAAHLLPFLARKKVAFCMDSKAAIANLNNQGGKNPELRDSFVSWFFFCSRNNIEPYYVWLPRQHNWRADRLSKMIPTLWSLTNWDHSQLWALCPLVATLVDFNCILHSLHTWRLCSAGWTLLVHPVWPAMHWWNLLTSHTTDYWPLSPANRCLLSSTVIPPPWPMRASLLYFP